MPDPQPDSPRRYRVRPEQGELEMRLVYEGLSVPTEVLGLSMDGVQCRVERRWIDELPLGTCVSLRFCNPRGGARYEVLGLVETTLDEEGSWVADLHFHEQDELIQTLGQVGAWRHFNRRRHFRVYPRLGFSNPARIELQWPGYTGKHVLHDISAQGMAIRLARHDPLQVPGHRAVRAELHLPGAGGALQISLRKLRELEAGSHRRVCFEIDDLRTANFGDVQERLIAAVMDWQRASIQARHALKAHIESMGSKRAG
ncbi:MAG: PilZ domain-containing protein [Planctomycetota bacterium]